MDLEVEGIVLRQTLYSETSKVLQVLTKELGLISIIAKGSSSLKSKLRGLTIPFLYGKFEIRYKKDGLSILKSGVQYKIFGQKNANLKKYGYISYISELALKVAREENNKDIANILIKSLEYLETKNKYEEIKIWLQLAYLKYLGISPNLQMCQKCYGSTDLKYIDGKSGGLICDTCHTNEHELRLSVFETLKKLINMDINEIETINISADDKLDLNEFINEYYETYSAISLKSENFLNEIK